MALSLSALKRILIIRVILKFSKRKSIKYQYFISEVDFKFEVTDKTGRRLRMTDFNWHHIAKRHPEMASQKEKIIETLEKPDKITDSSRDDRVKYFYKYYKALPSPYRFVRVIVKYLNGNGFVISSHFVKAVQ
jgi:hypothetical protein